MYQIVICDDNAMDLNILKKGTEKWAGNNAIDSDSVIAFNDAAELKKSFINCSIKADLYILDVVMEPDGIELGRLIRKHNRNVPIIYVTSSPEYALDAYGIQAIRYLMKPFSQNELESALDMAFQLHNMRPKQTILVKNGDMMTGIVMDDIMYLENELHTITYNMNDSTKIQSVRRSGTFESSVGSIAADDNFIQPHKSFFVNLNYIYALHSDSITMDDGREIPVARKRFSTVREKYIEFISRNTK